jgi:hypothetical protein
LVFCVLCLFYLLGPLDIKLYVNIGASQAIASAVAAAAAAAMLLLTLP